MCYKCLNNMVDITELSSGLVPPSRFPEVQLLETFSYSMAAVELDSLVGRYRQSVSSCGSFALPDVAQIVIIEGN